jgi:hypothetical protein
VCTHNNHENPERCEVMSSDMHPTRGTRIPPKGLQPPLEAGATPGETGANKGSICRYNMLDSLLKASPLRARKRGPQPSAWKVNSPKLISLGSPLQPQRYLPGLLMDTSPYVPDEFFGLLRRKEEREATGSKPTYESPSSSSPFSKAVHARTAHFTRAG